MTTEKKVLENNVLIFALVISQSMYFYRPNRTGLGGKRGGFTPQQSASAAATVHLDITAEHKRFEI